MVDFRPLVPWRNDRQQTPARREDLLDPFVAFRREVDRMFDDFFDGFGGRSLRPPLGSWAGVSPNVDVTETAGRQ